LDNQQKDREVEGVERPAEPSRPPCIPLIFCGLAPPRDLPGIDRRHPPPLLFIRVQFGPFLLGLTRECREAIRKCQPLCRSSRMSIAGAPLTGGGDGGPIPAGPVRRPPGPPPAPCRGSRGSTGSPGSGSGTQPSFRPALARRTRSATSSRDRRARGRPVRRRSPPGDRRIRLRSPAPRSGSV